MTLDAKPLILQRRQPFWGARPARGAAATGAAAHVEAAAPPGADAA